MKIVTLPSAIACLLLSGNALAAPFDKRQDKGEVSDPLNSIQLTEIQPFRVQTIGALMPRQGAKSMRITYGPFNILGHEEARKANLPLRMDPGSTTWMHVAKGFPSDVTVLSTNTSILLETGEPATIAAGIYNHHTVFFDRAKSTPVVIDCPNKSAEERAASPKAVPMTILAGTSEDSSRSVYSSADGMFNSGFWLPQSDQIMFMGEVINYKNNTQRIFAVTDVEYVDGRPKDMLDAYSTVLSVNMCGPAGEDGAPKDLSIPRGQTKARLTSDPIVVTENGYFLYTKGHLHDGGDAISMKVNGKLVCVSKAQYGGPGQEFRTDDGKVWSTLSSMGECGQPIRVQKGDKLEIEAMYDFDAHPARRHAGGAMGEAEVMGIFGTTFAADKAS